MAGLSALAPAKVNLFLHVGPVERDGYHPLASLVAFADVGDQLTVESANRLSLDVTGPFAAAVGAEADNLILRALRALSEATATDLPLKLRLDKRLPVAAGLGGGSSDAGAALKLVRDFLGLPADNDRLAAIAGTIGADGPMCLHARTAWAERRGDDLTLEPRLPPLPALLVNPGVPSPTGGVYRGYDVAPRAFDGRPDEPADWRLDTVIDWLSEQRNDLEAPAVALQPAIAEALEEVGRMTGGRLVRMSGSGATVFALFRTVDEARAAARTLTARRPDWWVEAATLG